MSGRIQYGFRITHIDNIPYIENTGFVLASSLLASASYKPIGDKNVIDKRKTTIDGIDLTQYIPFYFGPRSIMLYVIQHGYNGVEKQLPENVVYCVVKIEDIIKNKVQCIFSDGHALSAFTKFYGSNQLSNLNEIISFDDVYAKYWNSEEDLDLKRRKEAELLVKEKLPREFICGFIVYSESAKLKLLGFGIDSRRVVVKPEFYF